jgi:hypothetical protein
MPLSLRPAPAHTQLAIYGSTERAETYAEKVEMARRMYPKGQHIAIIEPFYKVRPCEPSHR